MSHIIGSCSTLNADRPAIYVLPMIAACWIPKRRLHRAGGCVDSFETDQT